MAKVILNPPVTIDSQTPRLRTERPKNKLLRLEHPMLGLSPYFVRIRGRPIVVARSVVVTLISRLSIGLLIVILVGVILVVAWPVILIGAVILVLSKGTGAWKRPPTSPLRGLASDLVISGKAAS